MSKKLLYEDLTFEIIGCAMEVHKTLGTGFLESVYESAICVEFKGNKLPYDKQVSFLVIYKDRKIKDFVCDIVVDNKVIVELKAVNKITDIERAQLLNYLKVTNLKVGLLINFGEKSLKYERFVL